MNITKKLLLLLFVTGLVFTACKKNVSDDKDKTLNDTTATTSNDTSVSINLNSPVADEKILLRFQPVVGTTYIVESNVNSTMSEAQDTFKISYKSNKFGKVSLRILSKENTDYKMEFILKDVRETIKADTSTIEYKYGKALDYLFTQRIARSGIKWKFAKGVYAIQPLRPGEAMTTYNSIKPFWPRGLDFILLPIIKRFNF